MTCCSRLLWCPHHIDSADLPCVHSSLPQDPAMHLSAFCFLGHHWSSPECRGVCISPSGEILSQWRMDVQPPSFQVGCYRRHFSSFSESGPYRSEPLLPTTATLIICSLVCSPVLPFSLHCHSCSLPIKLPAPKLFCFGGNMFYIIV